MYPPSTGIINPVTYDDSFDAKNTTAASSSPGLPYLCIGTWVFAKSWNDCVSSTSFVSSVSKYPGQIALQVIPLVANSAATARVKLTTAPLLACYAIV